MRPREEGAGPGAGAMAGSAGQSRVTIQAKPQIKSKMGDVTRFMPTALKVKREARDQKGRLRVTGKGRAFSSYNLVIGCLLEAEVCFIT